jgi:hypothetical protein
VPADLGRLGLGRQVADRFDQLVDPVDDDTHVGAFGKLQRDRTDAKAGGGRHLVEPVGPAQRLLERDRERGLDILGRCTAPDGRHVDDLDLEVGEELDVEAGQPPDTGEQHDHHHQVRGDGVLRE